MADITELPDELIIPLRKPVTLGETFSTMTLREPTGAQMLEIDKYRGVEADIMSLVIVSGIPAPAVKMIGARDIRTGAKYLARFLYDDPETGDSDT